jgi:eukaryotic-like serine/threonine-protein kinase
MGVAEKIRTLFHAFVLFTVLVTVALLSAVTTIRLSLRGRQTKAPNLVGQTFEAGEFAAKDQGLDLKVVDHLYSNLPLGSIVSQLPPAGTPLKIGQHVDVLVSLGPKRVEVPDVIGSSLRAGEISAVQRGLTVGEVAQVHSASGAPQVIIAQDPTATSAAVRGPGISLLISLGSVPAAYSCPSFIGQPLADARPRLEKAGFKIGQVIAVEGQSPPAQAGRPPGTILSQSPPPGSKIQAGTTFDFQVAQ